MNSIVSADGTSIVFDRSGAGPALVLVGGALTTKAVFAQLAQLEPHFTLYAYDRRGRGDSGDTPPYAVEREVEDLQAIIEAAGGRAFVFGHSSGAALALQAAAHGLAIPRLAVYEPPFFADGGRSPLPEDYVVHLTELVTAGRRGDALDYYFTVALGLPAEAITRMRSGPAWGAWEAMAHTLAYDGAVVQAGTTGQARGTGSWALVTKPTLVLAGGRSPAWMQVSMRTLADALPRARLQLLEGQDHGAAPEVLVPVLRGFFLC